MDVQDKLNPSRMAVQALRIVIKEIELARPNGPLNPCKGKHGEITEMYAAMMILEHVVAYLYGTYDD